MMQSVHPNWLLDDVEVIVDDNMTISKQTYDLFVAMLWAEIRYRREITQEEPNWDVMDGHLDELDSAIRALADDFVQRKNDRTMAEYLGDWR